MTHNVFWKIIRFHRSRQPRLNRVNVLLAEFGSQEKQLQTELTNKANVEKNVSSLKQEIEELSNVRLECLSEKTEAEATLKDTTIQLNKLLVTGTHKEWTDRKQQAARAYPIVHGYEEITEEAEGLLRSGDGIKGHCINTECRTCANRSRIARTSGGVSAYCEGS